MGKKNENFFWGGGKDKTTKTNVNELSLICGVLGPNFWGFGH
jgi:hypothetical protein